MMHMMGFGFSFFWLFLALLLLGTGIGIRNFLVHKRQSTNHIKDDRLEPRIFRLAAEKNGVLTVSDVVVHLDISSQDAEKALNRITDSTRVRMEVEENGRITYIFTEMLPEK